MKIYKARKGIVLEKEGKLYKSEATNWDAYINRDGLYDAIAKEVESMQPDGSLQSWLGSELLPPIGSQEIWASGVTYTRSREARMEESKNAGGGDFYARVYEADRPELFFKSNAARAVGSHQPVRIRRDSKWNVPEPELTLFITSSGKIVGYTIGNDMSSRDIEGENPLYLPQAKTYDGSASLGPCLFVPGKPIPMDTRIALAVKRSGTSIFESSITLDRMKRKLEELASWLYRENTFPQGTYLMTGTGIVPSSDFTLQVGDSIHISIDGIGTLVNTVEQRPL